MARLKRYSRVEVATKLAQANDLARQGKPQSEMARTLGCECHDLASVAQRGRAQSEGRPNCGTPPRNFTIAATGGRSPSCQARRSCPETKNFWREGTRTEIPINGQ